MEQEKQYKTTFNYILTHYVIPRMMFSDLNLFYDTILPNPKNMQIFMQNAIGNCKRMAEDNPEIEPPHEIKEFRAGMYGESQDKALIIVGGFPKARKMCDTIEIAFTYDKKIARYFTAELSFKLNPENPDQGKACFILGEWKPEAEGKFKHLNYGDIDIEGGKDFPELVANIVYGEKK